MSKKRNPVKVTIKPLAAYLHHIATTLPPNFTTHTAIELEKLYKRLGIKRVALELDGGGMSESSRELKKKTDKLLVMLRKWENEGRGLGVHNVETFETLKDTNLNGYWGLKEDYDEIADTAASVSSWLIELGDMVQSRLDSKADTQQATPKISKVAMSAQRAYEDAEKVLAEREIKCTDKNAWKYLDEEYDGDYKVPPFGTFTRYLRKYREATNTRKHNPRPKKGRGSTKQAGKGKINDLAELSNRYNK